MVVTAADRKSWWRELQESTFADGGEGCSAGEIDFSEAATVAEGIYADGRQVGRGGDLAKRGAIKRVVAGCSDADGKDELAEGAVHERVGRNLSQVIRKAEVRTGNQSTYDWTSAENCTVRQATLHSCKQCRPQLAMRRRQTRCARCCKVREARSVELLGNEHDQLIRERLDSARLLILWALGET